MPADGNTPTTRGAVGNKLRFAFVGLAFCVIISYPAGAQSVTGVLGYVRIPVATFHKDGSLLFGTSYLPQKYLPYSDYRYDAVAVYASLTFLSFIEVDLRVTRLLGMPSGSSHVADRVPTVRFNVLKEKKWIPAVTLGFHDVLTSLESGEAHHFGASYLVVTKNFSLPKLHLDIGTTAGWGAGEFVWENSEFIGLFGGISLGSDILPWMNLLVDYDGCSVNTGIRLAFFKRLTITAAAMNFDAFTGTLSYRLNLIR
jgi:hypothetical protein